eukprot:8804387-Ditylum_brightwellii.AAC.1
MCDQYKSISNDDPEHGIHRSRDTGAPSTDGRAVRCSEDGGIVRVQDGEKVILARAESYECAVLDDAVEVNSVEVNSVEVTLDYEMHTLSTANVNTELETLQADMLHYLAESFELGVKGCTGFDVSNGSGRALAPFRRRRLQEEDATKIIGLSGTNLHTLDPNHDCLPELDPNIPSTDCSAINGRFTASYINTDEAAVTTTIARALKQAMDNSDFTSPTIPALTFIGTRTTSPSKNDLVIDELIETRTSTANAAAAPSSTINALGAGILSGLIFSAVGLIALFLHKRHKQRTSHREDSDPMLGKQQQYDHSLSFDLEGVSTDSSDDEDAAPSPDSNVYDPLHDHPAHQQ